MRNPISSAITALPRNENLKRGVYSLDIPDRPERYQHVLSILPGNKIDELFQDGLLCSNTGDKILECWEDFADLMSERDELGGFQFLEVGHTRADELRMSDDKRYIARRTR